MNSLYLLLHPFLDFGTHTPKTFNTPQQPEQILLIKYHASAAFDSIYPK